MWAAEQRAGGREVKVRRSATGAVLVGSMEGVEEDAPPANLMYDRRVVRGSTHRSFSAALMSYQRDVVEGGAAPAFLGAGGFGPGGQGAVKRRGGGAKRRVKQTAAGSGFGAASQLAKTVTHRVRLPLEADGREHVGEDPESRQDALAAFLESKLTEPVKQVVQRDFQGHTARFLPKEPEAPFVPAKCGSVDTGTQIETLDEEAEISDFDDAGEALFELIAEKTLETAMMEVAEEAELREIRHRWRVAMKEKDAAETAIQDVQFKIRRENATKAKQVTAAAAMQEQVRQAAHDQTVARLAEANVAATAAAAAAEAATKEEGGKEEEKSGGAWLRVFVDRSGGQEPACVGPIPVVPEDTVRAVEERVLEWIAAHDEVDAASIAGDASLPLRLCTSGAPLPRAQTLMRAVADGARLQLVRVSG